MPDPTLPAPTDAITVEKIFRKLSFGPLSNLSMAGEGNGTIVESSQGKVIEHLNNGLLKLYSRFVIREKEVLVQLIDGYTMYHLYKRFAQSRTNTSDDPKFILDATNPFQQDIIKILDVYSPSGIKYVLNDEENKYSLYTPYPNVLQVPEPTDGNILSVIYQARHRELEQGIPLALVYLPEVLHQALIYFIGSEVYSNMGGAENTVKGSELLAKYENECQTVKDNDLVSTSLSTRNTVFAKRGWV